jgi:transposase
MMGRQTGDQSQLFYLFNLERRIPTGNLLRRINPVVTRILVELRDKLASFYSDIGRPSIDPELMIRMLIIGYCYGIRSERRLCEEVELHLAYRWFCRLDLDDQVPDHSTFSVNRHGRFRDSDILRQVFEAVVRACMDAGLVKGEGFVVDASVMEANASRYHGKAPGGISLRMRVAEVLRGYGQCPGRSHSDYACPAEPSKPGQHLAGVQWHWTKRVTAGGDAAPDDASHRSRCHPLTIAARPRGGSRPTSPSCRRCSARHKSRRLLW